MGLTDAKKFANTDFAKTTGGKILGLGADILGSPSNLLMMLIPGAGEAKIGMDIAESAGRMASAGAKTAKIAKGVEEGAEVAEDVAKAGKGAEEIAKTGEEVAKGIEGGAEVAESAGKVAEEASKLPTELDAIGAQNHNLMLKHMRSYHEIPEGLKGNHMAEAVFEAGKKEDFSKS
ncbi:hypothetical protein Zmor_022099 [Zophobas morio]|uniref:Uncharacterized protein n=1 Tax=Zophobas morio TaxID=2755281 RepID=A0AA38M1D8_9CUCU|nr:hypothetical protein Zmor_022099 [Zophobas morio]